MKSIICIDARHAKAALKMQINKNDRNDAAGIARIMQTGWYREVRVKDHDSHAIKGLLVKVRRDIENQIRGLLKNLGLVIGRAKSPPSRGVPKNESTATQRLQHRWSLSSKPVRRSSSRLPTLIAKCCVWRAVTSKSDVS